MCVCVYNVFVVPLDLVGVLIKSPVSVTAVVDEITVATPIKFECIKTCTVCSDVTLSWTFKGSTLPNGVMTETSPAGKTITLILFEGSEQLEGEYMCLGVSKEGTVLVSESAYVTVLKIATVVIIDRSKIVPKGGTAIFECESSRAATFQWNFDSINGPLPATAVPSVISDTFSQLVISQVEEGVNTGLYFCSGTFDITGETLVADADLTEQRELEQV